MEHGSVAPWSWDQEATFPPPEELAQAALRTPAHWDLEVAGALDRIAEGPSGQRARVIDHVLLARRRSDDA